MKTKSPAKKKTTASRTAKAVGSGRLVSCIPATCSHKQLCRIRRDHFDVGDFCLMTDAHSVWVSEQKLGEPQKQGVQIPRKVFNRLLRWYTRPSKFLRS